MPEYAELHQTAHQVMDAAHGHRFVRADVNTKWSLPCSLPAVDGVMLPADKHCPLPGTQSWTDGFEICARHRGKEVCLALRPAKLVADKVPLAAGPPVLPWCPTCAAAANDSEGSKPPLCPGHAQPCVRQTVRRSDSKNVGRRFWSCACESARERCSFFAWASPSKQAKEADWFPPTAAAASANGVLLLTIRRGMHGRCVLLRATEPEPQGAHLRFERSDGLVLYFCDARVRVSAEAIWQLSRFGGQYRRSPDPLYEYDDFRARALALLDPATPPVRDAAALLDGPACELLLDQRLMNGVGNYLRAEILFRAGVAPFEPARRALERARDADRPNRPAAEEEQPSAPAPAPVPGPALIPAPPGGGEPRVPVSASALAPASQSAPPSARGSSSAEARSRACPDLLTVVRDVLRQAVLDKGRDWLNVYGKRYAKKETDGLGRAVWYRGERGPLPSTLYEADGAWDSLFLARLPEALGKSELHALCSHFGAVDHITYNGRRLYAFVRFSQVASATAALKALHGKSLFGSALAVRYKRRLRKKRAADPMAEVRAAEGVVAAEGRAVATAPVEELPDEDEDEEVVMAGVDLEEAHEDEDSPTEATVSASEADAPGSARSFAATALTAPARVPEQGDEHDEDEEDAEWDEPVVATTAASSPSGRAGPSLLLRGTPVAASAARPAAAAQPESSFTRSIRSFAAASMLGAAASDRTAASGLPSARPVACEQGADGKLDDLQSLARSYNELASSELARM